MWGGRGTVDILAKFGRWKGFAILLAKSVEIYAKCTLGFAILTVAPSTPSHPSISSTHD
jgi:hypothetical protein